MKTHFYILSLILTIFILANPIYATGGRISVIMIITENEEYWVEDGDIVEIPEEELEDYIVRIEIEQDIGEPQFMYYLSHIHGYQSGVQVTPERFCNFEDLSGAHIYTARADERTGGNVWNFEIRNDLNEEPPIMRIEPRRQSFGGVVVGQSAELDFTMFNDGGSDLIVFNTRFPNGGERLFRIEGGDLENFRLAPNEQHVITVIYEPFQVDPEGYWVPIIFVCNYPERPNYEIFVGGGGIAGEPGNPVVENPIDDLNIDEDSGLHEIADLDDVFSDPDGDELLFEIIEAPEQLNMQIDEENVLTINPDQDYNSPNGVEVTVRCSDFVPLSAADNFQITINDVNDLPRQFDLLTPEDGFEMRYNPDSLGRLDFTWEEAVQNEYETDEVRYRVHFLSDDGNTFISEPFILPDYRNVRIKYLTDNLEIYREFPGMIEWWVVAYDGSDEEVESFEHSLFGIPALSVKPNSGTMKPRKFFLSNNYPNPFNSSTTVDFNLTNPGFVDMSVWDMSGKQISIIKSGNFSSGFHKVTWNAANFSAGTYLIRLQTGQISTFRQITLLK